MTLVSGKISHSNTVVLQNDTAEGLLVESDCESGRLRWNGVLIYTTVSNVALLIKQSV